MKVFVVEGISSFPGESVVLGVFSSMEKAIAFVNIENVRERITEHIIDLGVE